MLVTIRRKSIFYKILCFIRFFFVKGCYLNSMSLPNWGLIGKWNTLDLSKSTYIGKRLITSDFVEIYSKSKLKIGSNVTINSYSRIVTFEKVEIGDNVMIGQQVTILDHDHGYYFSDDKLCFSGYNTSPILIGNNVWIGDKVTILKGTVIGDNVIIGANSIVTHSTGDNVIVGGNPARIIRYLNE
ncbi:acyltransferase [Vibrio satsumensis]|uniref:acyltransferase n=1 Tax=Vibrio satsumensis TaxID=2910245 RepID=UPI003D0B1238